MEQWKGKVAVVTGASRGIGRAIVQSLVKHGMQVVGLARNESDLSTLSKSVSSYPGKFHPIKTDITNDSDIKSAISWTATTLGPIHLLVNNAGILQPTTISTGDPKMWRKVFDTNVLGLLVASKEVLTNFFANNTAGYIINISSTLGFKQAYLPGINVYGAAKFAVSNISETIRDELKERSSEIRVSNICPGLVATDLFDGNKVDLGITGSPMLNSEDIAEAVVYVLSVPKHVQINELVIKPLGEKF